MGLTLVKRDPYILQRMSEELSTENRTPAESEQETRIAERVPTRLTVRYGLVTTDRVGYAENISEGGMYINSNDIFGAGERLLIGIEFPERIIFRHGEVAWAIRVPDHLRESMVCGMGISFVGADPTWPLFFRRWKSIHK